MHIHDMALTETSFAVCGIGEFKWLSTNRIYLFYVLPSFYLFLCMRVCVCVYGLLPDSNKDLILI